MNTTIWTIIGIIIGVLINHFVVRPIEQKHYYKKCIKEGLAKEESDNE
jgi:uncharacterized membrane-anchored protein YhcB (DUF1043 family)